LDELIDLYWVALSTELEENSNFYVAENTCIYIDVDELNDILSTNGHLKVYEAGEINNL
jgi:predicted GNAT family N-acyltransferase